MAPCMLTLPHATGRSPPYTTVNTKPHPLGPQGLDYLYLVFFLRSIEFSVTVNALKQQRF